MSEQGACIMQVNEAFTVKPSAMRVAADIAVTLVNRNAAQFRSDFADWLRENYHVYKEFERRANRLWNAGRKHYSARGIAESIRFDTEIAERDGEFKINGNFVPDMAQLYSIFYRDRGSFFEFRRHGSKQ